MNWRTSGDTSFAAWDALLPASSQIKKNGESRQCYEAARPLSKLCLGMLKGESSFATDFDAVPARMNNPLHLKHEHGQSFIQFATIADCIRTWRERITSDTYKDGVYADTVTVEDLVSVYAPGYDNNIVPAYTATIEGVVNSLPDLTGGSPPMAALVFGRVPKPAIIDMIVSKPYDGAGFTRVSPRQNVGVCDHITDGEASLEWYAAFFGTGGERQNDALTDYGIDKAGRIAMWNDPFGTRSPWASGGSDGLEGDGPLFVRTLGVGAINGRLASKEHVGRSPAKLTDAQLESSAQLTAWLFDGSNNHPRASKVPWHAYPLNPNVGCVTHMQHWEFATKPCPGPGVIGQTNALQNRVRAIMKHAQEGESQAEVPPPDPVTPDHGRYPDGIDKGLAELWFGVGELHRVGKPNGRFKFHEGRAWAEAWVERGAKEKAWPRVVAWHQLQDSPEITRDIITFANGWVLGRFNARAGWRWL